MINRVIEPKRRLKIPVKKRSRWALLLERVTDGETTENDAYTLMRALVALDAVVKAYPSSEYFAPLARLTGWHKYMCELEVMPEDEDGAAGGG